MMNQAQELAMIRARGMNGGQPAMGGAGIAPPQAQGVVARPGMGAVAPAAPVQPGVGSARVMGPSPMPMGYAPPQQAQVGQPMQQLGGAIAQAAAPQLAPHLQPHGINSGEMGQPWNLRFNQARR